MINNEIIVHVDMYGIKQTHELREYVCKKALNHVIYVNEWIDSKNKAKALGECTLLVLPSHSEGIPNVILEAMASMTPIVSTLAGGLKEVLVDGHNAVIAEIGNSVDLSEKLSMCLKDKLLREHISNNAFLEIIKQYDIRVVKKDFDAIVEQITLS
jgi:glycosyltransferase involved in cell wall biosynthesis